MEEGHEKLFLENLSDETLLRFLEKQTPKALKDFYDENLRIRRLCMQDEMLNGLVLKGFVDTIIDEYSPLEEYLRCEEYVNRVEQQVCKLRDIHNSFDGNKWNKSYEELWRILLGLQGEKFSPSLVSTLDEVNWSFLSDTLMIGFVKYKGYIDK